MAYGRGQAEDGSDVDWEPERDAVEREESERFAGEQRGVGVPDLQEPFRMRTQSRFLLSFLTVPHNREERGTDLVSDVRNELSFKKGVGSRRTDIGA